MRHPSVHTLLAAPMFAALFAWLSLPGPARGQVMPETADAPARASWVRDHFQNAQAAPPFSFVFAGQASDGLLARWPKREETRALDNRRTQTTLRWTDPASGLECRCVRVEYADFPAVEWTVWFRNTGARDTPLLEKIQGLDAVFVGSGSGDVTLHGIRGDSCSADSYAPFRHALRLNETRSFAPPAHSGKSCDGPSGWPYFNLQLPGGGVLLAVGWPGQWAAAFTRTDACAVRAAAGQAVTRLALQSGEEIRTPLTAVLFWRGAETCDAQNLWRRWYLAHVLPRIGGEPQQPVTEIQSGGSLGEIPGIQRRLEMGIRPDICWRDAGGRTTWYVNSGKPYEGKDAWLNTGTWEINPAKYPDGFKPFSDWAHAQGMQFLLWFEPERVGDPSSWLATRHPEWLLPGTSHGSLLDLGNPDALAWLIGHVDGMVKSQGLDWYREDMNGGGPLPAWRKRDEPDRQGATENHYVQGHLAFWDGLKKRNPLLRIDSCASGGRRNDLETMRRAVPLLRSDFQRPEMARVAEGNQGHTYGLSFWLPFQGTATYAYDAYTFRSFYAACFGMGGLTPQNEQAQKQAYSECRRIAPRLLGDYYPLTPYSLEADCWIAWQFNMPEQGDGVVQAFRRPACAESDKSFLLRGLDPAAKYEVTDLDRPGQLRMSGRELMGKGLKLSLAASPGSALILYSRAGGGQ